MTSKFCKSSSMKHVHGGFQPYSSYLYELDLTIQPNNWLKQDAKLHRTPPEKDKRLS